MDRDEIAGARCKITWMANSARHSGQTTSIYFAAANEADLNTTVSNRTQTCRRAWAVDVIVLNAQNELLSQTGDGVVSLRR